MNITAWRAGLVAAVVGLAFTILAVCVVTVFVEWVWSWLS